MNRPELVNYLDREIGLILKGPNTSSSRAILLNVDLYGILITHKLTEVDCFYPWGNISEITLLKKREV